MNTHTRRATNLSLDADLLAQARALNINLSRAAETGLRAAVTRAQSDDWRRQNADALDAANDWVAERGLPLARYRQF